MVTITEKGLANKGAMQTRDEKSRALSFYTGAAMHSNEATLAGVAIKYSSSKTSKLLP